MDFSTADGVYSQINGRTTEVSHHTSNTLPHTYSSSLVNVQQNNTNEEELL